MDTVTSPSVPPKRKSSFVRAIKQYRDVFPFLIIGFLFTAVFVVFPIIKGIHMSFYEYQVLNPSESRFVGLENYIELFQDSKFYLALRNTALMVLISVPGQWFFGLMVALMINLKFLKFKVLLRMIFYFPVITSWIVVAYLFKFLFASGESGIVNYLLLQLAFIDQPINWLQHTWTANVVIWTISIWKGVGYVMILYLAALMSIPMTLYEAAKIDGAKGAKSFMYVTLPLMKPMTVYVLINLIIGAFTAFLQVYFITDGGPLGTTELVNTYMFKYAFEFFEFGYGASVSVIIGITVFLLTYSQQRHFGKERIELG